MKFLTLGVSLISNALDVFKDFKYLENVIISIALGVC